MREGTGHHRDALWSLRQAGDDAEGGRGRARYIAVVYLAAREKDHRQAQKRDRIQGVRQQARKNRKKAASDGKIFAKAIAFSAGLWYTIRREYLRNEVKTMKAGIHPEYKEVTIRCACGESVTTRSTKGDANGELRVDICSKCHPFFTGKQKYVDAGGRVDKFKKRLEGRGNK